MSITQIDPSQLSIDLQSFIETLPDADTIRDRIECNGHEAKFLKRLLRLAVDAGKVREHTGVQQ